MRKITNVESLDDGTEIELDYAPSEWITMLRAQVGDMHVIAYCTHDDEYSLADNDDSQGTLYSFHRHSDNAAKGLRALGNDSDGEMDLEAIWGNHEDEAIGKYLMRVRRNYSFREAASNFPHTRPTSWVDALALLLTDAQSARWNCVVYENEMQAVLEEMWSEPAYFPGNKDAQLLSCYDHSGQVWSLSGTGMQCQWDTSNKAGVWVPSAHLVAQLDIDGTNGLNRDGWAKAYARQFLDEYNDILAGNVYGIVVAWYDADGAKIDDDTCWGFVGNDYAEETMRADYFDPVCKRLQAEHDEAVRCQGGTQMEMEI